MSLEQKRALVFPNGESLTRAVYVWGESLQEFLDNASSRLDLRKPAKFLYTIEGQQVALHTRSRRHAPHTQARGHTQIQAYRCANTDTDRQTDRQTDRHTHTH